MMYKLSAWMLALMIMGCASTTSNVTGPKSTPLDADSSAPALSADHTLSTGIPASIRQPPRQDLQLAQVRQDSSRYADNSVRWGGTILSLQNIEGWTRIRVRAYPLDELGRPQTDSSDLGVFVVQAKVPFDKPTYAQGREITVAGTVHADMQRQNIAKQAQVPLLTAEDLYLWEKTEAREQDFAVTSPSYGGDPNCHYVYQGRCYSYYTPRGFRYYSPWRYGYWTPRYYGYWPRRYGYGHPWYRYGDGYRHRYVWPHTFFHFGFYGDL